MSGNDCPPIEKLRKENLEQFLTLVRMHLSFVVDINTDDVDNSTDKPKQFRWNFHKKTKNATQTTNGKTVADTNSITDEGMARVYELIEFLSQDENVKQEGIFRRTGSLNRQQELRQLLLSGSSLGLEDSRFSVHDCASVLKGFIAELPQPLLMDQYYQTYCTLAAQYPPNVESSENKLLTALQLLLLLLSPLHRDFLNKLLTLLKKAADNESSNRMSPDTLATMFTPHLLCPRRLSPETFHTDSLALAPLISFMIRHSSKLFEAPNQLATDVAAYFTIRERKRVMSPNIDLDESITDRTAANTVYTFVDRHRTKVENETNQTDTALAQLYAHIQALPDSQHKRRLIKQFNRQNGYGTPIQVQRTGKAAGSRSFGDSIKRHIFNKGILNKTPKKMGSGSNIPAVEEESIMTPRSRKPLIITEQRVSLPEQNTEKQMENASKSSDTIYQSISPKNDSDFVSSDDEMLSRSSLHSYEHNSSNLSAVRSENTRFVIANDKRSQLVEQDLNTTLCGSENGILIPKFKINHEVSDISHKSKSLSGPFREYLLSRSVLTATPVDLSLLNNSNAEGKMTDSLMFCLDGNVPSELSSGVNDLVGDKVRTPLNSLNCVERSPNRKRVSMIHDVIETKKVNKENIKVHETDL